MIHNFLIMKYTLIGDFMNKLFCYLKYLGLFFLFILVSAIFISLINLTGISSTFISKLGVILTAISFFVIASLASKKTQDKGYILGIKLGLLFIFTLLIINLIFFRSKLSIDQIIYYIILLASSILGGSFGKNFKPKK